ncbi:kinesin-like protein KIF3B [Salmo salar]|uniref:Kinesin-like protein n=1 Tax=Salmo salar TaxID=8030 RepID=A0A1S3RLU8_SALSA|nr:kinesin-like protein KIF3B [Salmo salar]|eukprot:XP_014053290.1 PREDICTED: kinesin-like protein KIF3B [Salmo salar]
MSRQCEAVKVVVRCRPFNRREETMDNDNILEVNTKLGQITLRNPRASPEELMKSFTFDAVYDSESKQSDIYDDTVRPLVDSVLQGFNGTILAYGQTGTGKTFTMLGMPTDNERGIIPNSFNHIFTQISRSQNQQYLVRASYLEIYREEVRDLLCKDNNKKLDLKENPDSGVYVKDLSSVVSKNVMEIEHVMNIGDQSRSVGFTNMNERSSRSHAIFMITVECSEKGADGEDHIRVGKLNMVDLAGSERQRKTGANGERLKEATKINLSLSALGNVISALVDGKSTHIPYRDSKLTRLLQDSLGGNAKTVMVATLGPASKNYEESLTTLRYANRAKNIKNKPKINEDPKDALLREFQEEITRLKAQLEERGMLAKERRRRRNSRRLTKSMIVEDVAHRERDAELWKALEAEWERNAKYYIKEEQESKRKKEEERSIAISRFKSMDNSVEGRAQKVVTSTIPIHRFSSVEDSPKKALPTSAHSSPGAREKWKPFGEKEQMENERMMDHMQKEQESMEKIIEKYKAMESKILAGGKNIIDHTNEQQKMLELKRQEIAEQIRREREIQQQVLAQDEETGELRETFSSLQQEVDLKTKKLKRLYAKLQLVKAEIGDVIDEHVVTRQELEQTQNELTRELKFKYLLIENFIPPEEKNKIMNRLHFDSEEDQWRFKSSVTSESKLAHQVKRRPTSVVGYKRPISQYAQMAVTTGAQSRYRAENVMLLELDMSPPTMYNLNLNGAHLEQAFGGPGSPRRDLLVNVPFRDRTTASGRVRKSRSWYQAPRSSSSCVSSSSSSSSITQGPQTQSSPHPQRPSSAIYTPLEGAIPGSP